MLAEFARRRLAGILAAVADRADLVVGLEGLPALFRGGPAGSNRPVLLSFLPQLLDETAGVVRSRDVADRADAG